MSLFTDLDGNQIPVLDDTNTEQLEKLSVGTGRGYKPRDWKEAPAGYAGPVFEDELLREDEVRAIVKQREADNTTNRELKRRFKILSRTQGQTSSCWAYSDVQGMRYVWARQTGIVPNLCPTSTLCYITGFQDVGGFNARFIKEVERRGINTVEDGWRMNSFSSRNDTPEMRAKALARKGCEHLDLPLRGLSAKKRAQYTWTALYKYGPVPAGYDWMGHAILLVDLLILSDGSLAWFADNSGLYRDKNGETVFSFTKGIPNDACVPTSLRFAT